MGGVPSGSGKLTYSSNDRDLESYTGAWRNGKKSGGLLVYREYVTGLPISDCPAVLNTMASYLPVTRVMALASFIFLLGLGMKVIGKLMKCMAWMVSTTSKMSGNSLPRLTDQGDVYEGSFYRDKLDGQGKLLHANGDQYIGGWRSGLKDGYGVYDLKSIGLKYDGFWSQVPVIPCPPKI